jgi:hypothetical protein
MAAAPTYRPGVVYYDSGRPYYYTSGVRYWGYPRYYNGPRYGYTHVDVHRDVTRNYYVDRRTTYHGGSYHGGSYHGAYRHPYTTSTTHVKGQPKQTVVKKKKVYVEDQH